MLGGPLACSSDGSDDGGRAVEAFDLEPGACFNRPAEASQVKEVEVVDCAEAHDFEVYHSFQLADGPYPGAAAMEEEWIQGCIAPFESFVGSTFDESVLDISAIFPTSESWDQVGDREVVCSVTAVDGVPRTGSAAGSGD